MISFFPTKKSSYGPKWFKLEQNDIMSHVTEQGGPAPRVGETPKYLFL